MNFYAINYELTRYFEFELSAISAHYFWRENANFQKNNNLNFRAKMTDILPFDFWHEML